MLSSTEKRLKDVEKIVSMLDEWRMDVICMGCETLHNREILHTALGLMIDVRNSAFKDE